MPSLVVTTAATVEPVSVAEMKTHLRVETSDDDTYIEALIKAAREAVETSQKRALINTTYTWKFDNLWDALDKSGRWLRPPRSKLSSVTSITYVDTSGNTQTLATSVYGVDTNSEPGRIYLKYAQNWPSDVRVIEDAWTIVFVAGYGATAASVPETTKNAIKLEVEKLYDSPDAAKAESLDKAINSLAGLNAVPEFY